MRPDCSPCTRPVTTKGSARASTPLPRPRRFPPRSGSFGSPMDSWRDRHTGTRPAPCRRGVRGFARTPTAIAGTGHGTSWNGAVRRAQRIHAALPQLVRRRAYQFWQLASIALIERTFDHVFLVGVPPTLNRDPDPDAAARATISRTRLRHYPDVPRLFLAFATAAEFASWGSDSPDPVWIDGERIEQPASCAGYQDRRQNRTRTDSTSDDRICRGRESDTLWELADIFRGLKPVPFAYARLAGEPLIQAERHVRLGNTYLRLARPHLALPELVKAAAETADPFVVYLAHYFRGRAFEMLDRKSDAEDAHGGLDTMPRAVCIDIARGIVVRWRPTR